MPNIPVNVEPMAVSTADAAKLLGVSRPIIYRLMREEGLPSFKIGTRTLIPVEGMKAWVSLKTGSGADGIPSTPTYTPSGSRVIL